MIAFWLLIGVVVGAYVGITVYRMINSPKRGEKTVNAYVESLFKLRAMVQADTSRNRVLPMINNVMPATVYQLGIRNKDTNELMTFSVDEEKAKFIQEKDSGKLTFNGDKFIAFQKG